MLVFLALVMLAGCSSLPTSQTTKDLDVAPQYTQEEKDAMTEEEKVAAYNESMSQDKNKLVCRREVVVGSHFKQTVCRTRAEIEAQRRAAQEALGPDRGLTGDPYGN
jgi:predicted kinase